MSSNISYPLNNSYSTPIYNRTLIRENSCLSISVCKKDLKNILESINQLRNKVNCLKISKSSLCDTAWNSKLIEIKNIQHIISNSILKYKDKPFQSSLKELLRKKRKKRNRLNRRNIQLKRGKEEMIKNRKILEEITNDWIKKELEKDLERKRHKEATERSEVVLYAVNKKIADAQRYIHLLDTAEKLRKLRKKLYPEKNYGENDFAIKVSRLKNVWRNALFEYEIEKRKLQLFLSKSTKPLEQQWKEVIFGEDFQNDSMNIEPKTLHEFIEIRRAWDSYIVPEEYRYGSSIPRGWVMPNEKPSEQWNLYTTID